MYFNDIFQDKRLLLLIKLNMLLFSLYKNTDWHLRRSKASPCRMNVLACLLSFYSIICSVAADCYSTRECLELKEQVVV